MLASLYLGLMPIAWPGLPWNVHLADLLFPVLAFQVFRHHRHGWQLQLFDYWILVYLIALVPSVAASDDIESSGIELFKRAYLALVYVVFVVYFKAEGYVVAVRALTIAAVLLCVTGALSAAGYYLTHLGLDPIGHPAAIPYLGTVFRLFGLTESPAMFGNYLVFVLPLLCAAGLSGLTGRRSWRAQIVLAGVAMGLTFSHALAGFATAGLVMAWPFLQGRGRVVLRTAVVAGTVLLVLALNAMLTVTVRRVELRHDFDTSVASATFLHAFRGSQGAERVNLQISYNLMSYYLLKKAALDAFLERPWTGAGLDRFHTVTERAYEDGRLDETYRAADPHSTVFGALAETGLMGGVATPLLLLVALLRIPRADGSSGRWFVLASRAAILGLVVNSINTDIMNFRFLWVAFAVLHSRA